MKDFSVLLRARPLVAQHLRRDFAAFCKAAWPTLHPGAKLSWTVAHDLICEWLVSVWQGRMKRLIVNCPPRFAKSSMVTILFPIWVWLQDPRTNFLACSYEIDLATNHNLDRRRVMESKWFRDLFADAFQLSTDRSQAQEFSTTAGGTMQAASTNSKAMGRGGDIIICDDPLSGDVAYSESYRNEVNFWCEHQLPQRLNNPSESAIVIVMQRLHQSDPTGFLLSQEDSEWTLLKLPLIAEQDEVIVFPVSGRKWARKKGDCLDPKRWSPRTVRERQRNRLVWASQFQQEPMAAEGNIIRTDDILFFGGRDPQTGVMDPGLPESFERKIISVDCSFKDLRTSDFVALIVVGVLGSRRYLLHVTNAHLDLTGTENEIRNAHAMYGPISATLVEDKANGPAVISHLKDEIAGVIAVDPQGGKMPRMVAAAPEFQAHNWILERNGPWTTETVKQLTVFPNAKHDDVSDAISQAAIWLQANSAQYGVLDFFKRAKAEIQAGVRNIFGEKKPKPAPVVAEAKETRVESRIPPEQMPVCPLCKSSKTVARMPVDGGYRCKQCGVNLDALGRATSKPDDEIVVGVNCCPNPLLQTVGGVQRCGNCGRQTVPPPVAGVGFAYLKGRKFNGFMLRM